MIKYLKDTILLESLKIRNYLIIILLFISSNTFCQNNNEEDEIIIKNTLIIGAFFTPAYTGLISDIKSDTLKYLSFTNKNSFGFNGGISIKYILINNEKYHKGFSFGIGSGIQINNYNNKITMNEFNDTISKIDKDNDKYLLKVNIKALEETNNLITLGIPVNFIFKYRLNSKSSVFCSLGLDFLFPISFTNKPKGTVSYKGYYKQYADVTLDDLQEYGFYNDAKLTNNNNDDNIKLKRLNIGGNAELGMNLKLTENLGFNISAYGNLFFSSISDYNAVDFHSTEILGKYNSIMFTGSKVKPQMFGLKLGLEYKL